MNKVLELRQKRADIWDKAKAFLSERQNESGMLSPEDTATYEKMEREVVDLGSAIEREERATQLERELSAPANAPLTSRPDKDQHGEKPGRSSAAYNEAFWTHMRDRSSYEVRNALKVGELSEGGYTVPDVRP